MVECFELSVLSRVCINAPLAAKLPLTLEPCLQKERVSKQWGPCVTDLFSSSALDPVFADCESTFTTPSLCATSLSGTGSTALADCFLAGFLPQEVDVMLPATPQDCVPLQVIPESPMVQRDASAVKVRSTKLVRFVSFFAGHVDDAQRQLFAKSCTALWRVMSTSYLY